MLSGTDAPTVHATHVPQDAAVPRKRGNLRRRQPNSPPGLPGRVFLGHDGCDKYVTAEDHCATGPPEAWGRARSAMAMARKHLEDGKPSWPQTGGRADPGRRRLVWGTVSEGSPISPRSPRGGPAHGRYAMVLTEAHTSRIHQRASGAPPWSWTQGVRTGADAAFTLSCAACSRPNGPCLATVELGDHRFVVITATTDCASPTRSAVADWTTSRRAAMPCTQMQSKAKARTLLEHEYVGDCGLERLRILCRPTPSMRRSRRLSASMRLLGARKVKMSITSDQIRVWIHPRACR